MEGVNLPDKTLSIDELFKKFSSSENGLSNKEAALRVKKYGLNALPKKNQMLLIKNIVSQFSDLLVIILVVAGVLSSLLGDSRTAVVMFAVVLLNASIGFWQQYKTERTLEALKNMLPPTARIVRNGIEKDTFASEIVSGDIVILQAGDSVPADGRVIEAYSLKINESALTGESDPQKKHADYDQHHPKSCLVFMGTTVLEGEAKILVTATGVRTEFGKIALEAKSTENDLSPLQKKLRQVGKTVSIIAVTVMVVMIVYQLIRNRVIDERAITPNFFREVFLFGLALAASLVPEGLPATVSVALSLGALRLAKKKAVVKKLSSVETLGGTQVICTDKTGTLTDGEMSLTSVWPLSSAEEIPLASFDIYGYRHMLINWATCHNVKVGEKGLIGNSNEVAIVEAITKKKIRFEEYEKKYDRVHEFSFNSERKMMSVLVEDEAGYYLYAKGSPSIILSKCKINQEQLQKVIQRADEMAGKGTRVLAFAHKEILGYKEKDVNDSKKFEAEMIFDGLIGIKDDIRPEVVEAVEYCHQAGIRIIMITGDYKVTAEATANQVRLSGDKKIRSISGEGLYKMNELELRENLQYPCVFYQTDPKQKLRIVNALQNMGLTVAVTGDGVNDALALKKADIGIAMGSGGTDVAREAADMILLDDNFATIVNAVLEGRIIWNNLKRFIFYVFSSNTGEFMTAFLGVIFGLPLPLLAVQVLSVDLGTDVLPSLALAADTEDKDSLTRQKVDRRKENLLGREILIRLFYVGIIMGGGAVLNFWLINRTASGNFDVYYQATGASFATLVVCQVVNVISIRGGIRSLKRIVFENKYLLFSIVAEILILIGVIYFPPFQKFLSTKPLSLNNWMYICSVALLFAIVEEIRIGRSRIVYKRKEQIVALS